jgi:hypothetical protein
MTAFKGWKKGWEMKEGPKKRGQFTDISILPKYLQGQIDNLCKGNQHLEQKSGLHSHGQENFQTVISFFCF